MKICVLQPSYENSDIDYKNFDPPREISTLIPDARFHYEFLKKATVYKQLKNLKKENFDIYVNLCEGSLDWDTPSIDVIHALESLNLPYTGPTTNLYDPSKELMKYVAYTVSVPTPDFVPVKTESDIELVDNNLKYPLFIKPGHAGDSLGIDLNSRVETREELYSKTKLLLEEFDSILVEEYIEGREFSVLVLSNVENSFAPIALRPLEFVFPKGTFFKTYKLKTTEYHPECNIPSSDPALNEKLTSAAKSIFAAFEGAGYARMDFRVDKNGNIFFLEVNFACSVFYKEGYYGTADYILQHDGFGPSNFLKHIIQEGISRHNSRQNKYYSKKNGVSGYGIFALCDIAKGEVVFQGENKPQRIATKKYIEKNWKEEKQIENFKKFAYPIGNEVFILWDENPANWAPQNHACNANTGFDGLNIIALKDINKDSELTLDYTIFYGKEMDPFECNCGAPSCKKIIRGRSH
ncbi:MAG: SET domain-containing protein-lysine N-methyltransferase [Leptospiraceae bacterium]|nr:SET domain-containing protein-lysine N-methyltransferase [Leptospiraceae bacterium]